MDINLAIEEAMQKVNSGDLRSAQIILANILGQEPRNTRAWYLLSQIVGDRNREIDCLKKVLEIEPTSQQAEARLQKLQGENSQAPPGPILPSSPSTAKNPSRFLIFLILIFVGICILYTGLQIYNAPNATNCVGENLTCLVDHGGGDTYLFGTIKNTCDKPITNISLQGNVISPLDNQVLGEASAVQNYILAPGETAQYNLIAPNTYYGENLACRIDVKGAYFVK
jgi:hypothetical protein